MKAATCPGIGPFVRKKRRAEGAVLACAAAWAALCMQGCLPPDWSFCDCDFRDNFWTSVANDVHMLWDWDGRGFIAKARDNTTFQGKFLQGPMPEGYDCPVNADRFWKAWPQFGMSRGLIEGSMGDLWMPAARDRIKGTCMAGHLSLALICSQHFLVKAAREQENGAPDFMRWLEAAYSHMVSIRNLGQAHQLRNCMGQQGWPTKVGALHAYTEKWLGPEHRGANPMAAYAGGKVDPYGMLFDTPQAHTEKSRIDALPDRRPCTPYKEPKCWKRMSKLVLETCDHCCNAFTHKTGRGDPRCFDEVWTFERCCQTDFIDLVCEIKRAGEEGGCVDCAKSVIYICLTPPEKRLQDAQANYNKDVDKFNGLQTTATDLKKQIEEAQVDLMQKDGVYREMHSVFSDRLNIWNAAYNNRSRFMSEAKLKNQIDVWNASDWALKAANDTLAWARESLRNATQLQKGARDQEAAAWEMVHKNASAARAADAAHNVSREQLAAAQAGLGEAAAKLEVADAGALRAAEADEEAEVRARAADRELRDAHLRVAVELDGALVAQRLAERGQAEAAAREAEAEEAAKEARGGQAKAAGGLQEASAALAKVQTWQAAEEKARNVSSCGLQEIARERLRQEAKLKDARDMQSNAQEALVGRVGRSASVLCLLRNTEANASSRPRSTRSATGGSVAACVGPKDKNEFCTQWATEGECVANPAYMLKACQRSCSKAPTCSGEGLDAVMPESDPFAVLSASIDDLVAELVQAAALPEDEEPIEDIDPEISGADVAAQARVASVSVPDAFEREIETALEMLRNLKEKIPGEERNVTNKENELEAAERAVESAINIQEAANISRNEAAVEVVYLDRISAGAEDTVRKSNASVALSMQSVGERRKEVRMLRDALSKAKKLEEDLDGAQKAAGEDARNRRDIVARLKKQASLLQDHISHLNGSLSENMTTVVSDWLQQREAEEFDRESASWSARLLSAAKSALVSMVSNIELFLETYVVSLKDRQMILELVRNVEDLRATKPRLRDAEEAAANAAQQATEAQASLTRAKEARAGTEATIEPALGRATEAEEELRLAESTLAGHQKDLEKATTHLKVSRAALAEREVRLDERLKATAAAKSAVLVRKEHLRQAVEAKEAATARVSEGIASVNAARYAHREAVSAAQRDFHSHLQKHCKASNAEFVAYKESEEVFSFLRALVISRSRAERSSRARHMSTAANHSIAEINLEDAKVAVAAAQKARDERATEEEAAREVQERRDAAHMQMRSVRIDADTVLSERRAQHKELASPLESLAIVADHAASDRLTAKRGVTDKTNLRALAEADLARMLNHTRASEQGLVVAERTWVKAVAALSAAEAWLEVFLPTLQLWAKDLVVQDWVEVEAAKLKIQQHILRRQQRMSTLLKTHVHNLALIETELECKRKESERIEAKANFHKAEGDVVAAQQKHDKLVIDEEKAQQDIRETYANLQKLLEEHRLAQEGWDKQDPEDRKRSFSTSLSR